MLSAQCAHDSSWPELPAGKRIGTVAQRGTMSCNPRLAETLCKQTYSLHSKLVLKEGFEYLNNVVAAPIPAEQPSPTAVEHRGVA